MESKRSGRRLVFMFAFIAAAFLLIGWRFWNLQIAHGSYYHGLAESDELREIPLSAPRGKIVVANGVTIATSRPQWTLYDLSSTGTLPLSEIHRLARYLNESSASLQHTIQSALAADPDYDPIVLDGDVTAAQMTLIDENLYRLPHIKIQAVAERSYPYGSIMGNVIGYLGQQSATIEVGMVWFGGRI